MSEIERIDQAIEWTEGLIRYAQDKPDESYWGKVHNATTRNVCETSLAALREKRVRAYARNRSWYSGDVLSLAELRALCCTMVSVLSYTTGDRRDLWLIEVITDNQPGGTMVFQSLRGDSLVCFQEIDYGKTWHAYAVVEEEPQA